MQHLADFDTEAQFESLRKETHGYWKYIDMWLRRGPNPPLPRLDLLAVKSGLTPGKIHLPCHHRLIWLLRTCATRREYLAAPSKEQVMIKKRFGQESTWRILWRAATFFETLVSLCGAGIIGLLVAHFADIMAELNKTDHNFELGPDTAAKVTRVLRACTSDWTKDFTAGLREYDDSMSLLLCGFCEKNVENLAAGVNGYNAVRHKHVQTIRKCLTFNLH